MPHSTEREPASRPLAPDEATELAQTLKALSSPARLQLLTELVEGERTVELLARAAGLSVSATSHHLRILRALRLVRAAERAVMPTTRSMTITCSELLAAVRHHHEHVHPLRPAAVPAKLPAKKGVSPIAMRPATGTSPRARPRISRRCHEGLRAVHISLAVLGVTAIVQTVVFMASGSVALLADLIHNFGDAITAIPLGRCCSLLGRRADVGADCSSSSRSSSGRASPATRQSSA